MTLAELRTVLAEYLSTNDFTSTQIDGFITRAEQRIGRDARLIENLVTATLTAVSGVLTVTRLVEVRTISSGSASSLRFLKPIDKREANRYGTSGDATVYYIDGTVNVIPSSDGDFDVEYWEYQDLIADGTDTPILLRYENLYMDAALAEASIRLRDYDAASWFTARYESAMQTANKAARRIYRPYPVTRSGTGSRLARAT